MKDNFILNKDDYKDLELNVHTNSKKNKLYIEELIYILNKLEANQIKYVVLKGCASTIYNYKNIYDRIFKDIDLLVHPHNIEAIEDILFNTGYVYGDLVDNMIMPAKRREIIYKRLKTHEIFNMIKKHSTGMYTKIDVNFKFMWEEFENIEFPLEEVFKNINHIKYCNHNISILNSNFHFIHSAVHFYNEAFYFSFDIDQKHYDDPHELRLFRMVDIILIINKNDIDIGMIYEMSVNLKCVHKIEFVISIIALLLGSDFVKGFNKYFNITEGYQIIFSKTGNTIDWPITIYERIFDLKKRKEACKAFVKKGAFL